MGGLDDPHPLGGICSEEIGWGRREQGTHVETRGLGALLWLHENKVTHIYGYFQDILESQEP